MGAEQTFYAERNPWMKDWRVWKRTRTGDRRIAGDMSERTARLVARLLNEHEQEGARQHG